MKTHSILLNLIFLSLLKIPVAGQTYIQVNLDQPPELQITDLPDLELVSGSSILLGGENIVTGGYGEYSYSWLPDEDLRFSISSQPEASPDNTTSFMLTVSDQKGCSDIAQQLVIVSTNTSAFSKPDGLLVNVFPIPADNKINISIIYKEEMERVGLQFFNLAGELLYERICHPDNTSLEETVELKHFHSGSYTLLISSEDFTIRRHILIF